MTNMKSPITGKEMTRCVERRTLTYKGEPREIDYHFYRCEDSGECFTTTELDEINMAQLITEGHVE